MIEPEEYFELFGDFKEVELQLSGGEGVTILEEKDNMLVSYFFSEKINRGYLCEHHKVTNGYGYEKHILIRYSVDHPAMPIETSEKPRATAFLNASVV